MLVDMVDLGNEPDTRAEEHRAQDVKGLLRYAALHK